jgi:hypothetical protein
MNISMLHNSGGRSFSQTEQQSNTKKKPPARWPHETGIIQLETLATKGPLSLKVPVLINHF